MNGAIFGISDLPTADLARIAETCEAAAIAADNENALDMGEDLATAAEIVRIYAGIPSAEPTAKSTTISGLFGRTITQIETDQTTIGHPPIPTVYDDPGLSI